MYLSNDKEKMDLYMNYFKSKKEEDYYNSIYGFNFYKKMCVVFDINTLLTQKIQDANICTSYGDYNSKIVILIDNENKNLMNLLKDKIDNNFDFKLSNIYTTYLNKTTKEELSKEEKQLMVKVLQKELVSMKPRLIINLSKLNDKYLKVNEKVNIASIDNEKIIKLLDFDKGNENVEVEISLIEKELIDTLNIMKNFY